MASPADKAPSFRIGTGFDVHAFADGRELMLGGCRIPHDRGLAGHSDADVLLHAIIDAVLGALSLGDIGRQFPDSDPGYKDIDSSILFQRVWRQVRQRGWQLGNCDAVVVAEEPRLAGRIELIQNRIAELFDAAAEQVSVKATTSEGLGFVGRREGIAANAVVLLVRS